MILYLLTYSKTINKNEIKEIKKVYAYQKNKPSYLQGCPMLFIKLYFVHGGDMQREIKDHQETEFLVQRESEDKRDTQKTGS